MFGSRGATARAAGISTTTLYRWLQGKAVPNPAYMRKLARAASRLSSDIPAQQTDAPASSDDDGDAGDYYDTFDEQDDSDFEPVEDRRPRGLYVVGGGAAPRESSSRPAPSGGDEEERGGFELPGFVRRALAIGEDIKPLTAKEAAALRESTILAFQRFWRYGDEAITATNAERAVAHIWSDIEREETELIVDGLIARGMESAAAAQIVRGISNIWNYYAVGLILLPRFWRTFRFYADHGGIAL